MKKYVAIILTLAMALSLCACVQTEPPGITAPSVTASADPTAIQTELSETVIPQTPEPAFTDYVCKYEDQRDLEWEEDVVYFAKLYLGEYGAKGHPYLVANQAQVWNLDNQPTMRYFYNEDLREMFISQIYVLIDQIPELTDSQIVYELRRIAALLGDAHTDVMVPYDSFFPLAVEEMEHEGELGIFVTRIPEEYAELLYARLVSINGISVEEVIRRLSEYIPTENEYWSRRQISVFYGLMLVDQNALQAVGVLGAGVDVAEFRFVTGYGVEMNVKLNALDVEDELWDLWYVDRVQYSVDMLSYSKYNECCYFFSYLSKNDALYIRLYNMREDTSYPVDTFLNELRSRLKAVNGVDKIIVDVRDNPGGYVEFVDYVIDFLKEVDTDHIYVLMNGGSFSGGTAFPSRAKSVLENVTLVGSPAAQPSNFFANARNFELRKHDVSFSISYAYYESDPEFEGTALMPDITVYQTLTDYIQGIDTVLQTVLDMD